MKRIIKNILGEEFFYNNIKEIRRSVVGCETFLDLGCGSQSPYIKYIHEDCHKATGVDLYAKINPGYKEIVRKDVLEFIKDVPDKFYDAVLGFDIVEHFNKKDSIHLINEMQRIAAKVVVIVTPNGFWPGMINGPGQDHLCGVTYTEFKEAGFKVWGGGGISFFRSKNHSFLKGFRSLETLPFQMFVFNFGQLVAKKNPRLAYGVCAIKKIQE